MINIVTTVAMTREDLGFVITGMIRGVEVIPHKHRRWPSDLDIFVGHSKARCESVMPVEPYAMGRPEFEGYPTGLVIPSIPKDGSVEQLLTRRAVWAEKMPSLYDMPFGEFYGDIITTPDGSRHGSPLSGAGLACVQWLTNTLGHYPSLDEQAAAVASWEIARHDMIRLKAMGCEAYPLTCQTMAQARRLAKIRGITLVKVAKETAPSRWNVTTAEALIPILLGG